MTATDPVADPAPTGFSAVDREPESASLVAALDAQAAMPAILRLRAAAAELLAPGAGRVLVDVGSGTGEVARSLARLTGPTGHVIGIEPSTVMLDEARRRTDANLPLTFRRGGLPRLELDDASVHGVHCERVFQHLQEPRAAAAELARITRPGGRVVVIDTDWGMHAVHGADPQLTTVVVASWAAATVNGWSGRQLPALLTDVGLHDLVVVAETLWSTNLSQATGPPITTMADLAMQTGALDPVDAELWLHQLADAGRQGRFFWAVTMVAVAGTRARQPATAPV